MIIGKKALIDLEGIEGTDLTKISVILSWGKDRILPGEWKLIIPHKYQEIITRAIADLLTEKMGSKKIMISKPV